MERFPGGGQEAPEFKPAFELEPSPPEQSGRPDSTLEDDLAPAPATAWQPNAAPDRHAPHHIDSHSPHSESESVRSQVPETAAKRPQPGLVSPLGHTALSLTLQHDLAPAPDAEPRLPEPSSARQLGHTALDRTIHRDLAPSPTTAWQPGTPPSEASSNEHNRTSPQDTTGQLRYDALDRESHLDFVPSPATSAQPEVVSSESRPHRADPARQPDDTSSRLDYAALTRTVDQASEPVTGQGERTPRRIGAHVPDPAADDQSPRRSDPEYDAYRRFAEVIVNGRGPQDGTNDSTGAIDDGADDPAIARKRLDGHSRIQMAREIENVEISGRPDDDVDRWLPQARNDLGIQNTCGITVVSKMAERLGVQTSETQLVHTALREGLCDTRSDDAKEWGGVTSAQQVELLRSVGLDGDRRSGGTTDELAELVKEGYIVSIEVNARDMIHRTDPRFPEELLPNTDELPPRNHVWYLTNAVELVHHPAAVDEMREPIGLVGHDPTGRPGVMLPVELLQEIWERNGGYHLIAHRPAPDPV
jgi:hypothetical protein